MCSLTVCRRGKRGRCPEWAGRQLRPGAQDRPRSRRRPWQPQKLWHLKGDTHNVQVSELKELFILRVCVSVLFYWLTHVPQHSHSCLELLPDKDNGSSEHIGAFRCLCFPDACVFVCLVLPQSVMLWKHVEIYVSS